MKKIVFDNSIHLGQFNIADESMRISAKNSQVMLSGKSDQEVVGIESFNENAYSDDIIWGLEREVQDTFYPFMDVYHSVKNVIRVPLRADDSEMALKISKEFNIGLSNALTCAIAIREKADEIHSFYPEFQKEDIKAFMKSFGVSVGIPAQEKRFFEENLEELYQNALKKFQKKDINLVSKFHE